MLYLLIWSHNIMFRSNLLDNVLGTCYEFVEFVLWRLIGFLIELWICGFFCTKTLQCNRMCILLLNLLIKCGILYAGVFRDTSCFLIPATMWVWSSTSSFQSLFKKRMLNLFLNIWFRLLFFFFCRVRRDCNWLSRC